MLNASRTEAPGPGSPRTRMASPMPSQRSEPRLAAAPSMVSSTSGFAPGAGGVKVSLSRMGCRAGDLRGEVAVGDDGRERAAVLDRDEVRLRRGGKEFERAAVGGVDLDDRFLLDDEVGEEIAELRALVLDGLEGGQRGADAGGERRAADHPLAEGDLLRGAAGEDEGIVGERRLLRRQLVLGVAAFQRGRARGRRGSRGRCPRSARTRMVSPMPSARSAPMPMALLIRPSSPSPASVTPRWSG